MKFLLSIFLVTAFAMAAFADIQAPPASDYSPTRKAGRGLSNILFGITEIPYTICMVNESEGNNAAFSYGILKGINRAFYRFGKGWYDVATGPFPSYKASYRPPYRSNLIWGYNGYTEFPPELGFESRYSYTRTYGPY